MKVNHYIKEMKKIIKKILKEDDFDWVRQVDPNQHVDFSNAVIGNTYRVEFDELLLNALEACDHPTDIYFYSEKATVINIDYKIPYDQVYCHSENYDEVISVCLLFDLGEEGTDTFWVTDDMVLLYDTYDNLNESENDDLDWIRNAVSEDRTVTSENCFDGARVVLKRNSRYYGQSRGSVGTINYKNGNYPYEDDDFEIWVRVEWDNGSGNTYRIGENDFDLDFE